MQFLLIRHAESEYNRGLSPDLDSQLTNNGMKQSIVVGDWAKYNLDLEGYIGLTSPYLRCLQTASVFSELTRVNFSVEDELKENRLDEDLKGKKEIPNRLLDFQNIQWDSKWLSEESRVFQNNEKLEKFFERLRRFIDALEKQDQDKYLIVSHAMPISVLTDLLTGANVGYMTHQYGKEKNVLLGQLPKNASLTRIVDGKIEYRSKVVYE